jgi:hypothetical protein
MQPLGVWPRQAQRTHESRERPLKILRSHQVMGRQRPRRLSAVPDRRRPPYSAPPAAPWRGWIDSVLAPAFFPHGESEKARTGLLRPTIAFISPQNGATGRIPPDLHPREFPSCSLGVPEHFPDSSFTAPLGSFIFGPRHGGKTQSGRVIPGVSIHRIRNLHLALRHAPACDRAQTARVFTLSSPKTKRRRTYNSRQTLTNWCRRP